MSDIFDQLAAGNPAAHQPTQSNQPATPSQPQAQSGDIFDQLASGTSVSPQAQGNSQTQSTPIPLGQAPSLQPPAIASTKTQPGAYIPAPTAGAPTTPEGTSLRQKVIGTAENKVLAVAHDLTAAEKVAQHLATEAPTAPAIAYWQYKLHFGTPEEQATAKQKIDAMPGQAAMIMAGGEEAAPEMEAAEAAPEMEAAEAAPEAENVAEPKEPGIVSKLAKGENVNQPQAAGAFRNAAQASADDASVTAADTPSIRNLMDQPIENLAANERTAYDTLNDAAGTDLKSLYDRQSDLQDALDDPTQIANKTAIQNELKTIQSQITDGEANVTEKLGDDAPDLLNKAKGMTQKRYAMEDAAKKLFNNESVVNGNAAHGAPESINVDSAIRQVENLDKPSRFAPRGTPTRLQQWLGEDGAKTLKQNLYDAQKLGQSAITARKWAKWLSIGSVALGIVNPGYKIVKGLF